MVIEFNATKDAANRRKHGVSLALIGDLTATITGEARTVAGEPRQFVIGMVDGLTFYAVFVVRGEVLRPVSVRRAHQERVLDEAEIARRT